MKSNFLIVIGLLGLWATAQAAPIAQVAACGTTVTITAIPEDGFRFDKWNDGETANPRSVDAANESYIAYFASSETTGWSETGKDRVTLLPNVVTLGGTMTLKGLNEDEQTIIRVYSSTGHLMAQYTSVGEAKYILDAAGVSGCYFVHVSSPSVESILRYVVYAK